MAKSPDAFRTISEVADWLGLEAHVLRFWETKFTQVKPVKRAGGRRYYRPTDMALLGGIRRLLHDEGMTIRGVQKILREQGVSHVAGMSPDLHVDEVREVTPQQPTLTTRRPVTPKSQPVAPEPAPTLPYDKPSAAGIKTAPPRVGGGGLSASDLPELFRARAGRFDPAAAADILFRARALVERLRNTPG